MVGGRPKSERLPLRDLNDAQMLRTRMDKTVAFASFFQHGTELIRSTANDSARLRVAETALAVERFRLAHQNQLPGSLAALVPAYLKSVPTDPFDGQPLRFKRLEKGYVAYCIGTDLKDDGGPEAKQDAEGKWIRNQPFDITFTVER